MTDRVQVLIPSMGESVQEVVLAQCLVSEGEWVAQDAEIAELETDKVNQVIYAPCEGEVYFHAEPDQTLAIGALLAEVAPGQAPAAKSDPGKESARGNTTGNTTANTKERIEAPPQQASTKKSASKSKAPSRNEAKASSTSKDDGSSALGREGVEEFLQSLTSKPSAASLEPTSLSSFSMQASLPFSRELTRTRLPKIRQVIAQRLHYAKISTAMLTTFNEVDMTEVMALRKELKEEFLERHEVKLGFMSFFIRAIVRALKMVPGLNSFIEGDELIARHYCDISVAVSTERGLVVPVVRNCECKSFAQIEQEIGELARKAREGKITPQEMEGGGFTLTNGGVFGSLLSTPILNPPQSGILGMHTIQKRPMVVEDQILIRPMMYLALSYDHRVVDGKEAVTFLVEVKRALENPSRLLLEL